MAVAVAVAVAANKPHNKPINYAPTAPDSLRFVCPVIGALQGLGDMSEIVKQTKLQKNTWFSLSVFALTCILCVSISKHLMLGATDIGFGFLVGYGMVQVAVFYWSIRDSHDSSLGLALHMPYAYFLCQYFVMSYMHLLSRALSEEYWKQ